MLKIFLKTNLTLLLCLMATAVWAQQTIYVKQNATTGTNTGTSWTDAFTTLQAAIDAAGATDQIWVAAGTYLPTYELVATPVVTTTARDKTFLINKKVELYGGFDGTETNLSQRNWESNSTILSGDLNANGLDASDAYHVIVAVNAGATVLDGFTITGGYYYGAANNNLAIGGENIGRAYSGGLYVSGLLSDIAVKNCVFTGNRARTEGGALRAQNGGKVTVSECLFSNNETFTGGSAAGGAVIIVGATSSITIDRSRFINNKSNALGGAFYNSAGVANISNSLFYGNTALTSGGAVQMAGAGTTTISGTTIYGNTATAAGGDGAITVAGTTGTLKIHNSIIYGNTSGAGTSDDIGGTPAVATSEVKNSITQVYNPSFGTNVQVGVNPLFISTTDTDPDFLRLQATSPARNAGDITLAVGTHDLAGNPRHGGSLDLGAYQSAATLPIELESFDVKKVVNGAQLSWKVLSESENANFVIERSNDGQNFTVIATTPSKGNTNQAVSYNHTDNAPLNGKNYYRLSQADNDGTSKVLGIGVVDFDLSIAGIQVYPNPATDVVRVKVGSVQNNTVKVSLFSSTGNAVLTQQVNRSEAEQGFDLDVRSFNSGTYILVIDKGKVTEKTKVVIVR